MIALSSAEDYGRDGSGHRVNLRDPGQVRQLIRDLAAEEFGGLVHCAAAAPFNTDGDIGVINRELTTGVADLCNALAVPRLAFMSAWIVYDILSVPVPEGAPLGPANEYGKSKLESEQYFGAHLEKTAFLNLRLSTIFGAGQRSAGLIPNLLRAGLAGSPLRIRSVATRRDYLHIDDLAGAVKALLDQDPSEDLTLNLGSGRSDSVIEVAEAVQQVFREKYGQELKIEKQDQMQEGVPVDDRLDITRAQAMGLLEKTVGLQEGLAKTAAWMREAA